MTSTETLIGYGEIIDILAAVPVILRETRRRKGLAMRDAGDQLGIAASTVMRWERHQAEPSTSDIIRQRHHPHPAVGRVMTRVLPFVVTGAVAVAVAAFVGAPIWLAIPAGYVAMLAAAWLADRYTKRTSQVLAAMPPGEHVYAYDLGRRTGVGGRVYVHLAKLERAGLVRSGWDPWDPPELGRSHRRRWYERVSQP